MPINNAASQLENNKQNEQQTRTRTRTKTKTRTTANCPLVSRALIKTIMKSLNGISIAIFV